MTIDASTLREVEVTTIQGGDAGHNEVQQIAIRATGGTFTLTFSGQTTAAIAFDASALALEIALEALAAIDNVKVSKNSSVFKVEFVGAQKLTNVAAMTADPSALAPLTPADIVDYTIEITRGSAKNKVRIITAAELVGPDQWKLTLNKPWFSPFTEDGTIPDATSEYTLEVTNPNLLVKEETQADILWVNDTDNPGDFDDPEPPDRRHDGQPVRAGPDVLRHEPVRAEAVASRRARTAAPPARTRSSG